MFDHFGGQNQYFLVKMANRGAHLIKVLKLVILTPKMVENSYKIICILNAAKNYTSSNFQTPLLAPIITHL